MFDFVGMRDMLDISSKLALLKNSFLLAGKLDNKCNGNAICGVGVLHISWEPGFQDPS